MCEPLGTYLRHKTEIDQQSEPTNKESLRPLQNESKQKRTRITSIEVFTSMYWFALQHTTKMVLVKVKELIGIQPTYLPHTF